LPKRVFPGDMPFSLVNRGKEKKGGRERSNTLLAGRAPEGGKRRRECAGKKGGPTGLDVPMAHGISEAGGRR